MPSLRTIEDFLESIAQLPLEDQLMISEIIHKRVIEERRKELAASISESKMEYNSGKAEKGSVDDFLSSLEN